MKAFTDECLKKVAVFDINTIDHFESVPPSRDKKYFLKAVETIPNHFQNQNDIVLLPKTEPYEDRNGNDLLYMLICFLAGSLFFAIGHLWMSLDEEELHRQYPNIKLNKNSPDDLLRL